jgi:SAM-dependent methyltransferase
MSAVWHDVECGAYEADLPLWEELADETGGPVIDLGCGTGRVAMRLASRGHRVLGLDTDAELVGILAERAGELPAEAEAADAREFELGASFGLALAPMQLLQLFGGAEARIACLGCMAAHLRAGGLAAAAIVDELPRSDGDSVLPPTPDVREVDGWIYSSLPLETALDGDAIVVRRLRQTISPGGELSEEVDQVLLQALDASTLEAEGEAAGLHPAGRREIPATGDHVGSTAVLFERGAA